MGFLVLIILTGVVIAIVTSSSSGNKISREDSGLRRYFRARIFPRPVNITRSIRIF